MNCIASHCSQNKVCRALIMILYHWTFISENFPVECYGGLHSKMVGTECLYRIIWCGFCISRNQSYVVVIAEDLPWAQYVQLAADELLRILLILLALLASISRRFYSYCVACMKQAHNVRSGSQAPNMNPQTSPTCRHIEAIIASRQAE